LAQAHRVAAPEGDTAGEELGGDTAGEGAGRGASGSLRPPPIAPRAPMAFEGGASGQKEEEEEEEEAEEEGEGEQGMPARAVVPSLAVIGDTGGGPVSTRAAAGPPPVSRLAGGGGAAAPRNVSFDGVPNTTTPTPTPTHAATSATAAATPGEEEREEEREEEEEEAGKYWRGASEDEYRWEGDAVGIERDAEARALSRALLAAGDASTDKVHPYGTAHSQAQQTRLHGARVNPSGVGGAGGRGGGGGDDQFTPERHLATSGQREHSPQRHTAAGTAAPTTGRVGNRGAGGGGSMAGLPDGTGFEFNISPAAASRAAAQQEVISIY